MMWNYGYGLDTYNTLWAGPFAGIVTSLLVPLLLWSLFWKGWALWLAAKEDSKPWFITLLLVNTAGILDIVYIFFFAKKGKKKNHR